MARTLVFFLPRLNIISTSSHVDSNHNVKSTTVTGRPGSFVSTMCPVEPGDHLFKTESKSVQRRAHHTLHRQLVPASKSHLPGVGPLLWTDLGHAVARAVGLCDSIRDSRPEFATQVQDFLSGLGSQELVYVGDVYHARLMMALDSQPSWTRPVTFEGKPLRDWVDRAPHVFGELEMVPESHTGGSDPSRSTRNPDLPQRHLIKPIADTQSFGLGSTCVNTEMQATVQALKHSGMEMVFVSLMYNLDASHT